MAELSFLAKHYWKAIDAVRTLDKTHNWAWLRENYFDPESAWPSNAPSVADVTYAVEQLLLDEVREVRDRLLAESDWTQSRDVVLQNDADWVSYRQALRDVTANCTSLDDVVWPEKPEA